MTEQAAPPTTAASRYAQLSSDRDHFAERGDKCAKLTIPTLFQRDAKAVRSMKIKDPAQSMGARGVNTLASKMLLSLLPMNTPFFKLNSSTLLSQPDVDQEFKAAVLKGLGAYEKQAIRDIENSGDTTILFESIKHLIVVGNVLVYVGEKGSRYYDLNKFVVVRTPEGEWTEIVICEEVAPASLTAELRAKLSAEGKLQNEQHADKTLQMYTHVIRKDGRVKWHQEIGGHIIDGSKGDVPEDGNPWLPLRFITVDGEAYGRSYIEMFLGDLNNLEVLSKAVTEGSAAAAKVLFLVRPNGTTNPKVIAQAPNLSVRTGDANDVTVLRMEKQADLRVAQEMINNIKRELAFAFLINIEAMRDAERVTAEEVRYVAQELDDSLGGIYSLLSKEFQLPYVRRRLHLLRKNSDLPKLPEDVKPVIVTGFAALGRGHDSEKLLRFLEKVQLAAQASQATGGKLNLDAMISRLAIADGIETDGLITPQPVLDAAANTAKQEELVNNLGPEVIRQMGPAITQQMEGSPNGEIPNPG